MTVVAALFKIVSMRCIDAALPELLLKTNTVKCLTFEDSNKKTNYDFLERHLFTCSERVRNVYPENLYQIGETLYDKLVSFGIKYTSDQKLFKNLAIFNFESILCSRGDLQTHKNKNLDRETCPNICIHFFKPSGRSNNPLQL